MTTRPCNNCGGTGTDSNDATCILCDGTGDMEVAPRSDTKQQRAVLRQSKRARKTRATFPAGTRVQGRVGGQQGTVLRHVPGTNAQGGDLTIQWDSGQVGRGIGPITVEVISQ